MTTESNDVRAQPKREASPHEKETALFQRLIPILFVADVQAERDFYVSLGFTVTYQGAEFPDFIALGLGAIEFGFSAPGGIYRGPPRPRPHLAIWRHGYRDEQATVDCWWCRLP